MSQLAAKQFKNDIEANKLLAKHLGGEWRDKCEIGLALSKQLGNIYTGSLYLGMLSLVCNQSIDLTDKKVLMFSYGSGCAASMFILRFNPGYKNIQRIAYYKDRLASRVKVSPEDFDREMRMREEKFGLANIKPTVSILVLSLLFTFILGFHRSYRGRIVLSDQRGQELHSVVCYKDP